MFARLLLLFILVPLADLALLMVISKYTSIGWTIALVIVTGFIGAWLARRQGVSVGMRIRDRLSQNLNPGDLLTDGAMIIFAAGLLITPGLITDVVGFSLLIPSMRRGYKQWAMRWLKSHFQIQIVRGNSTAQPDVVDGEVVSERQAAPEVERIEK